MALLLEQKTDIGVPIAYHRIISVVVNSEISIIVVSYVDETYRILEKKQTATTTSYVPYYVQTKDYHFPLNKEDAITFSGLYEHLKTLEGFKGALDI